MLKNEQTINTEFTYDNMKVGKYNKEEDYITDRNKALIKKNQAVVIPGLRTGWRTAKEDLNRSSMSYLKRAVV